MNRGLRALDSIRRGWIHILAGPGIFVVIAVLVCGILAAGIVILGAGR